MSLEGTLLVFQFFFKHIPTIVQLPEEILDQELLEKKLDEAESYVITSRLQLVNKYNEDYAWLNKHLPLSYFHRSFGVRLLALLVLRLVCIIYVIWIGNLRVALLLSLIQFFISPYSFAVCIQSLISVTPQLFVGHYFAHFILTIILPESFSFKVPINVYMICSFFLVDQLLSVYSLYLSKYGRTEPICWDWLCIHSLYGFLNNKSYYLILLPLLYHNCFEFNLTIFLIEYLIGLDLRIRNFFFNRVFTKAFVSGIFYHQHRVAHLGALYGHAHKLHHFLQGTSPFEADIYGTGWPEGWGLLVVELIGSIFFNLGPTTLNSYNLIAAWNNKLSHTKSDHEDRNYHYYHHIYHTTNYGYFMIDLLFGTECKQSEYGNFRVTKIVNLENDSLQLVFSRKV